MKRIAFLLILLAFPLILFADLQWDVAGGQDQAVQAAPALQVGGQDPVRVLCGPPSVPGPTWSVVSQYLAWSGCDPDNWLCWSRWVPNDPSNALLENVWDRLPLNHGVSDPPSPWPPFGYINDIRRRCRDGDLAKGQWYHNAFTRPFFFFRSFPGEPPFMACDWILDPLPRHIWNFAEEDQCPFCELDPIATPPATVCGEDPIYDPADTPIPPTPTLLEPPDVEPMAYVRSSRIGSGAWYQTSQRYFYWPFQHYLNIRLAGRISEPAFGCAASSEVTRYLFTGISVDGSARQVCALGAIPPTPDQTQCLDPSGNCCRWRTPEEAVHLLFTLNEHQPETQDYSLHFWGIEPEPVRLDYVVETATTYFCLGEPSVRQVVWYFDLSLDVYLTKSVLRR